MVEIGCTCKPKSKDQNNYLKSNSELVNSNQIDQQITSVDWLP